MASIAQPRVAVRGEDQFFFVMSIVMSVIVIAGFVFKLAMGRSSFNAPLLVHAHAVVFMGWVALYVLQNYFVLTGRRAMHRTFGWIGAGWIVAMLVTGAMVTIAMLREGRTPAFYTPAYFLAVDMLQLLVFVGFAVAAVALRRRAAWHRRLQYCGMAVLVGFGITRLLPKPLLIPHVGHWMFGLVLLFPILGMLADRVRGARVHPAWWWGVGIIATSMVLADVFASGPIGAAAYARLTLGSKGAGLSPLAYPAPLRP